MKITGIPGREYELWNPDKIGGLMKINCEIDFGCVFYIMAIVMVSLVIFFLGVSYQQQEQQQEQRIISLSHISSEK